MLDDPGKDFLLQDLEGFRVAEETGHVDQDVLIQVLHFRRVLAQILRVLLQPVQLVQDHAAPDAASQRVGLVQTEVNARRPPQQRQNFVEAVLDRGLRRLFRAGFGGFGGGDVRMAADAREFFGDLFGREREVHAPGGDGAARHTVVLGGFRFLREGDPALGLNRFQPQRAVGGRARKDDADGACALIFRQRLQESVYRMAQPAPLLAGP